MNVDWRVCVYVYVCMCELDELKSVSCVRWAKRMRGKSRASSIYLSRLYSRVYLSKEKGKGRGFTREETCFKLRVGWVVTRSSPLAFDAILVWLITCKWFVNVTSNTSVLFFSRHTFVSSFLHLGRIHFSSSLSLSLSLSLHLALEECLDAFICLLPNAYWAVSSVSTGASVSSIHL